MHRNPNKVLILFSTLALLRAEDNKKRPPRLGEILEQMHQDEKKHRKVSEIQPR